MRHDNMNRASGGTRQGRGGDKKLEGNACSGGYIEVNVGHLPDHPHRPFLFPFINFHI